MSYETHLRHLSNDELRVLLLLHDLADENPAAKLDYSEFAHRARVVADDVVAVLTALNAQGRIAYAKHKLREIDGVPVTITFTAEKEEALRTLQVEHALVVQQLRAYEDGVTSGLAEQLNEPLATTIRTAEDVLGRGVTMREGFHLGELVARFGPQRVTQQLRKCRRQKHPLRATYAILAKGGAGKEWQRETAPLEHVDYYRPDPNVNPWT